MKKVVDDALGGSRASVVAVVVFVALLASACGAPTPSGSPAGSPASSPIAGTASEAPVASPPVDGEPSPEPGGGSSPSPAESIVPLPIPTMTDAFAIGEALYDPGRMDEAVVSLLDLMGVGIYARDGAPIRPGDERTAGDPWFYESEVRALIEMGRADLSDAGGGDAESLPYSMTDLQAMVEPLLPQVSVSELVSAFGEAYADHPDDLVPQVLLGQPLDAATQLTRVQIWLLFADGLVGPAGASTASSVVLARSLAAGGNPRWGSARPYLPQLRSPDSSMSDPDFREIANHFLTLSATVEFSLLQRVVHEGHGGPGPTTQFVAFIGNRGDFRSPIDGRTLLRQRGQWDGMEVIWNSGDPSMLRSHGSLAQNLPARSVINSRGITEIDYRPKKEQSNGQGAIARELADIFATASAIEVASRGYAIPPAVLAALSADTEAIAITEARQIPIEWHTPGIGVTVTNVYNVLTGASPDGLSTSAHRAGTDRATGVLTLRPDGTYRGTLQATVKSASQMEMVAPLAGGRCEDTVDGKQDLYVIGRPMPRGESDFHETLKNGAFGAGDLVLSFYPLIEPGGTRGRCQGLLAYLGPSRVDGQQMANSYLPFNDSKWNNPDIGYRIHLPADRQLTYEDKKDDFPSLKASSTWTVEVTR